jgi:ribosome biogenesis protein BRX1
LQLIKEQFTQVFGVPPGARRSKPFIDHVLAFTWADGRIWVRHYQISEEESAVKKDTEVSLVEIGPRKCCSPLPDWMDFF